MNNQYIIPIENLTFTREFNSDINVYRVRFVSIGKFLRRPSLYNVNSEELHKLTKSINNYWDNVSCIALVKFNKIDNYKEIIKIVHDELEILVGSIVGWKRRDSLIASRIQGININRQLNYILSKNDKIYPGFNRERFFGNLELDTFWKRNVYNRYYKIFLNNLNSYQPSWRKILKTVFQLCGKSYLTLFKNEAFLYNMIALETLLLNQNDKFKNRMEECFFAFLGWCPTWNDSQFVERMQKIYSKRCNMVHDGEINNIDINDISYTDEIIRNILINIIRHPKIFTCKNDVSKFVDKRIAERTLNYYKSKILPNKFIRSHGFSTLENKNILLL
jgi:hypothetical protein